MAQEIEPVDCCIVGAGPAGLQAAYLLKKQGVSIRVLERGDDVAQFFRQFPRHRMLISINKVNTGLSDPDTRLRFDWNSLLNDERLLFTDVSRKYFPGADDYVSYLESFAAPLADDIALNADVTRIAREGEVYVLECADGTRHAARHVIVATGVSKPWQPEVEGFDLVEDYFDFDIDPEGFENKRVLIIGKGNSAFETADALIEHAASIHVMSPNPVRLAWNSHFVGHVRAVNNNFLDTYQLKSQNAVVDAEIRKIERVDGAMRVHAMMTAADGHEIVLDYDRVIACTGFRFDASIFEPDIRPELKVMNKFPAMNGVWENENAPGVFFAGTIMQCRDYRKTMSGFVHGFRHNIACLVQFIAGRVNGTAYPSCQTSLEPAALTEMLIGRISTSSGLFLQPGFLCDVVVLDGPRAGEHLREVPVAWVDSDPELSQTPHIRTTLEFGDFGGNALHIKRSNNAFGENPDPFIHPVLRHFEGGELRKVMHLADHLDADWRQPGAKDPGTGTIQRMTYLDQGGAVSPADVAEAQMQHFLSGVLGKAEVQAAE